MQDDRRDDMQEQERDKFAYLTIKNNSFSHFAVFFFFFISKKFKDVLFLSTT